MNTIELGHLPDGTYSNCSFKASDRAGNESNQVILDPFFITNYDLANRLGFYNDPGDIKIDIELQRTYIAQGIRRFATDMSVFDFEDKEIKKFSNTGKIRTIFIDQGKGVMIGGDDDNFKGMIKYYDDKFDKKFEINIPPGKGGSGHSSIGKIYKDDNNYIAYGWINGFLPGIKEDPSISIEGDVFSVRFDNNGNVLNYEQFIEEGRDYHFFKLNVDDNSSLIIQSRSDNHGDFIELSKQRNDSTNIWLKNFLLERMNNEGTRSLSLGDAQITTDGGLLISTNKSGLFEILNNDNYSSGSALIKVDADGEIEWVKELEPSGTQDFFHSWASVLNNNRIAIRKSDRVEYFNYSGELINEVMLPQTYQYDDSNKYGEYIDPLILSMDGEFRSIGCTLNDNCTLFNQDLEVGIWDESLWDFAIYDD